MKTTSKEAYLALLTSVLDRPSRASRDDDSGGLVLLFGRAYLSLFGAAVIAAILMGLLRLLT
jgi:hypothetical protein